MVWLHSAYQSEGPHLQGNRDDGQAGHLWLGTQRLQSLCRRPQPWQGSSNDRGGCGCLMGIMEPPPMGGVPHCKWCRVGGVPTECSPDGPSEDGLQA